MPEGFLLGSEALKQIHALIRQHTADIVNKVNEAHRKNRATDSEEYLGKPSADVAQGGFEDVVIWTGTKGSETASDETIPDVYFRTQAVAASEFCYVYWIPGGFEANKAVC